MRNARKFVFAGMAFNYAHEVHGNNNNNNNVLRKYDL